MSTDGLETKKQENGSRVYFEMVIENTSKPKEKELLKAVKAVYPNVTDEWMETFDKQATALKSYLGRSKGYNYSRDSGFMPFLMGVASTRCGVRVAPTWNPADIYMVKRSKEPTIRKKIGELTQSQEQKQNLVMLNQYMKELLASRDLIPISLKKIKRNAPYAKIETANMGGGGMKKFSLITGSIKCTLSYGNKATYLFDTGEFAWDFYAGETLVHGQSRNFQYSVPRNLVQTELSPKGRDAGAKIGKASAQHLDAFLNKHGLRRPSSAASDPNIPAVGNWSDHDHEYWVKFYNKISKAKIKGSPVDFGELVAKDSSGNVSHGIENVLKVAISEEQKHRSAAGRFSSKLIGLRWVEVWWKLDKKNLIEDWLSTVYYGAKKEFGDLNGPFIKIY